MAPSSVYGGYVAEKGRLGGGKAGSGGGGTRGVLRRLNPANDSVAMVSFPSLSY